MDYAPDRKIRIRPMIMAFILIFVGIVTQINVFSSDDVLGWREILHSISGISLLVSGSLILLPRHRNIMSAIGLMCVGIGLSRLVVALSNTLQRADIYNINGLATLGIVLFGYVTLWFAAYQTYCGTNFLRGNSMNAFIMRFTSMGIVIMYVLIIVYANIFFGISYETLWRNRSDFLTSPLLYTMYFILLCSKEAFDYMAWEKTRQQILDVATPVNPGLITISPAEYERLQKTYSEVDVWSDIDDGSPVSKEIRFSLSASNRPLELVLRKWRTSEDVYVSIIPGGGSAFASAIHGTLRDVVFEEGCLHILGEDHPVATIYLSAKDDAPKKMAQFGRPRKTNDGGEGTR